MMTRKAGLIAVQILMKVEHFNSQQDRWIFLAKESTKMELGLTRLYYKHVFLGVSLEEISTVTNMVHFLVPIYIYQ